ncbi:PAS domain S-box-containing protein [Formivibrio citricus]|uniref:histidine kinase n=1 Tax=Formivibrio citricus TaxID=83765 RepID=A0A1I5D5Y1_9NEIS|nr:PAS domain S-box protein [Formivibrio citricus]SFN94674.1 PAS domain S-box-containing protein [Formivibrio citricus]
MTIVASRLILLFLACCAFLAQPVQAADLSQKRILLLYAYGYGGRGVELFSDGFFKSMTEAGFPVTNVHAEYLDLQRNRDVPGYREELREILHKKYAQRRIDLIVTLQQPALEFLLAEGREIAPQAPVITIQHRPLLETEKRGRSIVGEVNQFDIKGTLARALELFPQTQRVVFVSGSSAADIKVAEQAAQVAQPWKERLAFEYTIGMTLDDILQRVASLPPKSLIVFTQYNVDAKGRVALAYEAENMIVKAANAPVFGFYDYNLRNGGIGGSVIPVEASGERAGRLALDMLQGAGTADVGTLRMNESMPMFDWQQIQRWGGDVSRLPANTRFVNRPPAAWEQYGTVIAGTVAFLLAQSVTIAVLLANIRRRKRAEAVLGENEAKFRAIFDSIFDSVIFADTSRRIRLVNPAFTRTFGYSADEVIGRTTEFLYADPADYIEQGRRRFRDGTSEGGTYELRYRRKDGSEFWAESSGARITGPGGEVLGLMGMHRDITERKVAEKTYRSLYDNIMNSVVHCRVIFDTGRPVNFEYISTNPAFAEVTGIRENVAGRRISEVLPGYCEQNPESLAVFGRVAATGIPVRWEHYLALLDRWFSFYIYSPAAGEVVIVTENVTARKKAEQEIQRLNADLEQRVEQRTAELTAANKELDSFAYAVSHDLRAPLRAMTGFSQALIEDYGDKLDGDARTWLDQIAIASHKMSELIEGILALSRSTRGELQCDTVDLSALSANILAELARSEPERAVSAEVEPGLTVYGDPRMLASVMHNLLGNAWKYTARTSQPVVRVYSGEIDDCPAICVADNGAGFDMAHADQLFQPFRRLHRQDEFPGIGIGLATVQRIVRRHGGRITVKAAPGNGATFCFTLSREEVSA